MSVPDRRRCETCRFWNFISVANRAGTYSRGSCLRHAPQPADEERGKNLVNYCGTWFPETDSDDWCGEFRPIPLTVMVPRDAQTVYSACGTTRGVFSFSVEERGQ